ncbi:hypothetical protein Mycsm_02018 [Mycobacterium sp. JS623]|uniref:hypothetical protein n=1 Tax=Mycobacterium sp. JS623 TaxID=212767 RepID=UPI0002A555A6|nr:hypothetical protein [Mycobacterium sp. JS623]AGB22386.1 hypothetical protein Mycsm_02018 [Mycobacterium sp. JS623]
MKELSREASLAWTLADAVKPYLSGIERNHVFMAIGAGETFAAVRGMVKSVAVKRITLRPDLVQECITWLQAYVGHEDEQYLRRLIAEYLVPLSVHVPAAVRVDRQPSSSRVDQLVALTAQRHRFVSATGTAWLR